MKLNVSQFSLVATLAVIGMVGLVSTGCPGSSTTATDPYTGRLEILSVRTNPAHTQTITTAPQAEYYNPGEYPGADPADPYFHNAYVAESVGNIGEFGLTFENLDPKRTIMEVYAVYIVEDLEKIIFPIPIRIAENLMMDWRDKSWVRHQQPSVYGLWDMYPGVAFTGDHSGTNYVYKFIDMDPGKRWETYAAFGATPGLKVRVSAYGSLSDGTVVTTKPGHEVTLYLKPQAQGVASGATTIPTITALQKNSFCNSGSSTDLARLECKDRKGQFGCMGIEQDAASTTEISNFCTTN